MGNFCKPPAPLAGRQRRTILPMGRKDPKDYAIGPPPVFDREFIRASWATLEWWRTCRGYGQAEVSDFANWPCGDEEVRDAVAERYNKRFAALVGLTSEGAAAKMAAMDAEDGAQLSMDLG